MLLYITLLKISCDVLVYSDFQVSRLFSCVQSANARRGGWDHYANTASRIKMFSHILYTEDTEKMETTTTTTEFPSKKLCNFCLHQVSQSNIPRHLEKKHGFHENVSRLYSAAAVANQMTGESSDAFVSKYRCVYEQCCATVLDLAKHLIKVHGLKVTSDTYKDMMKTKKEASVLVKVQSRPPVTFVESATQTYEPLILGENNVSPPVVVVVCETGLVVDICKNHIGEYEEYLKTVSGGMKSAEMAKSAARQLSVVLKHTGTQAFLTANTAEKQSLVNRLDRLDVDFIQASLGSDDEKNKKKTASTVSNYLTSFERFLTWAAARMMNFVDADAASSVASRVHVWNRSLKKLTRRRNAQKKVDDSARTIQPDDISRFLNGSRYDRAAKLLADALFHVSGERPDCRDMDEHALVRNHVVMQFILHNACRAGPLTNVTLSEFKKAWIAGTQDGHYVIRVAEHKTASSFGYASLVLPDMEMDKAWTYVNSFRPHTVDVETVFVTWSGESMSSTTVSDIMSKEMGRGKLSSTLFRKTAVTEFLKADHGTLNERQCAKLMAHSTHMQKVVYNIEDSDSAMVEASKLLNSAVTKNVNNKKRPGPRMVVKIKKLKL